MHEKKEEIHESIQPGGWWRRLTIVLVFLVVLIGIFFGSVSVYAMRYSEHVLPGLSIGNIPIGGMSRDELRQFLQDMNDKLVAEGFHIRLDLGEENVSDFIIYPVVVSEDDSRELMQIDIEKDVNQIMEYGTFNGVFVRPLLVLWSTVRPTQVTLQHITSDGDRIKELLADRVAPYQKPPQNARVIVHSLTPFDYTLEEATAGNVFIYEDIVNIIVARWARLETPDISLTKTVLNPTIYTKDIERIESRLKEVLEAGSLRLLYNNSQTNQEESWSIGADEFARWLEIQSDEERGFGFGLNHASTSAYIVEEIAQRVDRIAQDARFDIDEQGKVKEFQGSQPGIAVDIEETYIALNAAFLERTWRTDSTTKMIALIFHKTEPNIHTGEINNLGISEVLGVGTSNFSGSPQNRIKNIRNAVHRLNGILIKPGEEFSAIRYTKPYTIEGGYLPELVIKGDEIKPEIGGGLCQIGTTLFRMAMNSAMPITQRRNHSLVVSYYNDPTNRLPGTDATIYEPAPDFAFLNDTGYYILIQTAMDVSNGELVFTLWGTSDGRKGSYSSPVVHRWISPGETRVIETTKISPGKRECQHAYVGADASFTYTRTFADGTIENTLYESHYRPLPEICLVGVEPQAACEQAEECPAEGAEQTQEEKIQQQEDTAPVVIE